MNYYNEIDPFCCQWLRDLQEEGLIPRGEVDERPIQEVTPDDLRGFTQCHFFAGIGGWSYALRLAGWPDDRPVWTGSCPCQPFSAAGKKKGANDERDLWPVFWRLIQECEPDQVFGEQVASAVNDGWLDRICADMEAEGYAVGACVLGAHSVGAPHVRQRLWWVADSGPSSQRRDNEDRPSSVWGQAPIQPRGRGEVRGMADAKLPSAARQREHGGASEAGKEVVLSASGNSRLSVLGDTSSPRFQRGNLEELRGTWWGLEGGESAGSSPAQWIPCRDGKARPIKPGLEPLAYGVSGRVGRLRAYGNAIVPQVAAEFISAVMDCA